MSRRSVTEETWTPLWDTLKGLGWSEQVSGRSTLYKPPQLKSRAAVVKHLGAALPAIEQVSPPGRSPTSPSAASATRMAAAAPTPQESPRKKRGHISLEVDATSLDLRTLEVGSVVVVPKKFATAWDGGFATITGIAADCITVDMAEDGGLDVRRGARS